MFRHVVGVISGNINCLDPVSAWFWQLPVSHTLPIPHTVPQGTASGQRKPALSAQRSTFDVPRSTLNITTTVSSDLYT